MRGQTQKQKVLELLRSGEAKQVQLWNISTNYRRWVKELRSEGYDIIVIYRLEGNYYQLIGEKTDGHTTNIATSLQTA